MFPFVLFEKGYRRDSLVVLVITFSDGWQKEEPVLSHGGRKPKEIQHYYILWHMRCSGENI